MLRMLIDVQETVIYKRDLISPFLVYIQILDKTDSKEWQVITGLFQEPWEYIVGLLHSLGVWERSFKSVREMKGTRKTFWVKRIAGEKAWI